MFIPSLLSNHGLLLNKKFQCCIKSHWKQQRSSDFTGYQLYFKLMLWHLSWICHAVTQPGGLRRLWKHLRQAFITEPVPCFNSLMGLGVMNTESKRVLAIDMSSLIVTISQVEAISLPILVTGLFIEIWKEVMKLYALRVKFQFNGNPYGNLNRMWDGFWFFCWPTFALLEHEPF